MPNWAGANSKAQDVRDSRKAAKLEEQANLKKKQEDAKWVDEVTEAKLTKKDDLATKKTEKLRKKAELKKLVEEEGKAEKEKPAKVTRADIQQRALLVSLASAKAAAVPEAETDDITENPNRALIAERAKAAAAGQELLYASSVSEFLAATSPLAADRAPEKRMKAAHAAYEEEWLPRMKDEFPSLKRSQLKDKIWKQWLKAPENPMNQLPTETLTQK